MYLSVLILDNLEPMLIKELNLPIWSLYHFKPILIKQLHRTILSYSHLIPPLIIPLAILDKITISILHTVFTHEHFHDISICIIPDVLSIFVNLYSVAVLIVSLDFTEFVGF